MSPANAFWSCSRIFLTFSGSHFATSPLQNVVKSARLSKRATGREDAFPWASSYAVFGGSLTERRYSMSSQP